MDEAIGKIKFVRNYSDMSTDKGFQFEFFCDRCGQGYRTQFKTFVTGGISDALETAGGIFGGLFHSASSIGSHARSATWQKAHDKAFIEAIGEMKGDFVQCPHCLSWVCREDCWNEKRGLCKECAPDLGVEMSAAQANRSTEEVWAHAKMADEDRKLADGNWRETIVATCPNCGKKLETNAKFCPECGHKLQTDDRCPSCGEKVSPGAKFCPNCGGRLT